MRTSFASLSVVIATLLLGGCGSGGGESSTGSVTIGITDAPVDGAENVFVQFTGVRIQPAEGETIAIDFDEPRQIDLLDLQGDARELLLNGEVLPTGQYQWIRLMVSAEADGIYDSYMVISGSHYELHIPSGSQTGLKLNRPFTVSDEPTDLTIDFDLRKSIHNAPGQSGPGGDIYFLRPTLRLVSTPDSGRIEGTLAASAFTGVDGCHDDPLVGYAVYLFEGSGQTPNDLDGTQPEPVVTARTALNDESRYAYTAAYLAPGEYTIAATCKAHMDDPETDDVLDFVGTAQVTVTAGETTTHHFE